MQALLGSAYAGVSTDIRDFSKKFPNTPLVIKAKHRDKNFVNQSLLIHKNISFTTETLAMDLIANSSICLGFNSAAPN